MIRRATKSTDLCTCKKTQKNMHTSTNLWMNYQPPDLPTHLWERRGNPPVILMARSLNMDIVALPHN